MIAVRVVEVPVHQIIDMVAVRYRGMAAVRSVHVINRMSRASVLWRAVVGVRRGDGKHVLIHMISMGMMQVTIVQVVYVPVMPDSDVPATGGMLVIMVVMVGLITCCHGHTPLR